MENKNRKTFGNAWMHRTLIKLLRRVDIRYVYRFMAVCVIPGAMVFSPGSRIAYQYFRKRRGQGRWQALLSTYRNHCLFGQTVIDKFAMYAGYHFEVHSTGHEHFYAHVREDQPVMLLNAHVGCSEMVGYNLSQTKPCNVLVYGGEKQEVMEYRRKQFADMGIKMIPVGVDGVDIMEIVDECVCRPLYESQEGASLDDPRLQGKTLPRSVLLGCEQRHRGVYGPCDETAGRLVRR